jgi:hypothetical protein
MPDIIHASYRKTKKQMLDNGWRADQATVGAI